MALTNNTVASANVAIRFATYLLSLISISERLKKLLPGYMTKLPNVLSAYQIIPKYSKVPRIHEPVRRCKSSTNKALINRAVLMMTTLSDV